MTEFKLKKIPATTIVAEGKGNSATQSKQPKPKQARNKTQKKK
jgi:hypothetical protein